MRLLFAKSASPHHGFAAYYTYLEKVFERRCRPSLSAPTAPWSSCRESRLACPATATPIASSSPSPTLLLCRQQPVGGDHRQAPLVRHTISYLTPPAENAGLYKGLKELKELIASYQGLKDSAVARHRELHRLHGHTCNLDKDYPELPTDDADAKDTLRERTASSVKSTPRSWRLRSDFCRAVFTPSVSRPPLRRPSPPSSTLPASTA